MSSKRKLSSVEGGMRGPGGLPKEKTVTGSLRAVAEMGWRLSLDWNTNSLMVV